MLRKWLEHVEEGLIAFLLAAMTVVTFGQVVARYVFGYSFSWALELSIYIFAALIFLGMSYGVRVGAHIGVDALVKAVPDKVAHWMTIVGTVLCMVYAAVVMYGGWVYLEKMRMIGIMAQDLPIPRWLPIVVLPLGSLLLLYRFGQILWQLLRGKDAHILGDEVADVMKYSSDEQEHKS